MFGCVLFNTTGTIALREGLHLARPSDYTLLTRAIIVILELMFKSPND